MMARSTVQALTASLPVSKRFRSFGGVQEATFWTIVAAGAYAIYLLLNVV